MNKIKYTRGSIQEQCNPFTHGKENGLILSTSCDNWTWEEYQMHIISLTNISDVVSWIFLENQVNMSSRRKVFSYQRHLCAEKEI